MKTSEVPASGATTPDSSLTRDGWPRGHRIYGWILAVAVVVLAVTWMVDGAKQEPYDSFTRALESGEVTAIEVAGSCEMAPDAKGFFRIEVYWRDNFRPRFAEVTQASSERQKQSARRSGHDTVVVSDDLVADWKELRPGLEVTERSMHTGGTVGANKGGAAVHQMPGWATILTLFLLLAVFVQIALGPQPRRVTRWGWFWLLLWVPTLAVPAYLLLGGPLGFGGRPRTSFRVSGPLVFVVALAGVIATVLL